MIPVNLKENPRSDRSYIAEICYTDIFLGHQHLKKRAGASEVTSQHCEQSRSCLLLVASVNAIDRHSVDTFAEYRK